MKNKPNYWKMLMVLFYWNPMTAMHKREEQIFVIIVT